MKICYVVLAFFVFFISSSTSAAVPDVVQILHTYDTALAGGLRMNLLWNEPTDIENPREPGYVQSEVEITGSLNGLIAMESRLSSFFPPAYLAPEERRSTLNPTEPNYPICAAEELRVCIRPMKPSAYQKILTQYFISPTDEVVKRVRLTPITDLFPKGKDAQCLYVVYRNILTLGRGFSQLLDAEVQVSPNEDGSYLLRGRGKHFFPGEGEWTIEVLPALDYLVRKASFTPKGAAEPEYEYIGDQNQERVGEAQGIPLWRSGEFHSNVGAGCVVQVELKDYARACDDALARDVEEMVDKRVDYLTIRDHQLIDGDGIPLMTTVGEESPGIAEGLDESARNIP